MPSTSGTASAPITFGSYGSGAAGFNNSTDVWIPPAGHDLVFDNLDFTGSGILFASAATGPGTYNITIKNSAFHDTPQAADQHRPTPQTTTGQSPTQPSPTPATPPSSSGATTSQSATPPSPTPAGTPPSPGAPTASTTKAPTTPSPTTTSPTTANGQAISIRFHGAHVYGNTIHDTPYGIAFFDYDTTAAPQGTSYIYDNRLWNITGYGFYYSNQPDPQGNPPTVNFVLASNTFTFNNANEAINVSEVPTNATITLANNIFTGSYGSAYRGCPTCTENNNDWYGATSNIPTGNGDLHVNPGLSAAPALAPAAGSPVVDAGTTTVPGLTYVAACDGGRSTTAARAPDQGAGEAHQLQCDRSPAPAPVHARHRAPPAPTPPPAADDGSRHRRRQCRRHDRFGPDGASPRGPDRQPRLRATVQRAGDRAGTVGRPAPRPDARLQLASLPGHRRGGRLSWTAESGDVAALPGARRTGTIVATTATPAFRFHGLGCDTTFTVGVAASTRSATSRRPWTLSRSSSVHTVARSAGPTRRAAGASAGIDRGARGTRQQSPHRRSVVPEAGSSESGASALRLEAGH